MAVQDVPVEIHEPPQPPEAIEPTGSELGAGAGARAA